MLSLLVGGATEKVFSVSGVGAIGGTALNVGATGDGVGSGELVGGGGGGVSGAELMEGGGGGGVAESFGATKDANSGTELNCFQSLRKEAVQINVSPLILSFLM